MSNTFPPNGGTAFPTCVSADNSGGLNTGTNGMSLRDWFAGQAIMGLMANSDLPDLFEKGFAPHKSAEVAYMVADAMLEVRKPSATG